MTPLTTWEPCLAGMDRDAAFFDGITVEVDRITDPRWDRVLPILEEEQVFMCRMMAPLLRSRPGARVLDVGTGSGVFAIYAAKLGCRAVALDISARALRFARHNAKINGIQTVGGEPGAHEIQFRQCGYKQLQDEEGFDFVFLSPPYNPTCEGFKPALHADAGELGQKCFEDQLPYAARFLRPGGVCIGNQMVPVSESGNLVFPDELQHHFSGGEFHYLRILSTDLPIRDFLEGQYASYLRSELRLKPDHEKVKRYIHNQSNNQSFALLYYELRHSQRGIAVSKDDAPVILTEARSRIPDPKSWEDRIKLHRKIIEHTSLEHSFPSPALFLETDALPDFPEPESEDVPSKSHWKVSVLRYIETWLAKTELVACETGIFDLILIDTAPWYPTPEGRRGLRQESATWVAPHQGGHSTAKEILALYQDNTERLQKTRIGPFLHRHFTGQNQPNEWRGIQFTVHDNPTATTDEGHSSKYTLVREMDDALDACHIDPQPHDIQEPTGLLNAAYATSTLATLGVPSAELVAFNREVRNRLGRLRELDRKLEGATDEELYPIDLELCHQAMHRRLDRLAASTGFRASGPSALIGIPVSLASHSANASEVTLPDNYRGGIWIYAIARQDWQPASERYLLDLARLLTMQYETEYSELAAAELKRIGSDMARFAWAHETKHIIQALRPWPRAPSDFGFIRDGLSSKDINTAHKEFAIVPFRTLFQAGLAHLQAWTMAGSASDLPFYGENERDLPSNLETLIKVAFGCAADAFLLRLFRKCDVTPDSIGPLEAVLAHIRLAMLEPQVVGTPEALRILVDWEADFWTGFSRLLLCEFREALQHSDWKRGIQVCVDAPAGAIEHISFINTPLYGGFESNIGELPLETPASLTMQRVVSAFTAPVVLANCGSGRKGDGTQVRNDIAVSLGATMVLSDTSREHFRIDYCWSRR